MKNKKYCVLLLFLIVFESALSSDPPRLLSEVFSITTILLKDCREAGLVSCREEKEIGQIGKLSLKKCNFLHTPFSRELDYYPSEHSPMCYPVLQQRAHCNV
jgi:hypothetical protein